MLDWDRVLATVGEVRDTLEVFRPEVFDIPLDDLVAATGSAAQRRAMDSELGLVERWRVRRQARALLRPGRPPADLHGALREARFQRYAWRELAGSGGRPEIPVELDRARAAHDALVDDVSWVDDRLPHAADDPDLVELDLPTLHDRMTALHAAARRLDAAPEIRLALDRLDRLGLTPLVEDLRDRQVPADRVRTELEWVWWCSVADDLAVADRRVAEFDGHRLTAAVETLVASDRDALEGQVPRVLTAVADRVAGLRRTHAAAETRLREEASRARRPSPLPDLFAEVGPLATAVRPCWLASPLTVPSVLGPGEHFDVVVVDEASLVAPAEVVAAVSRGRRVVVVGDPLQLPPVPFVVSAGVDAPEDADPDSVLDALDGLLPTRRLTWQYGALDERLVALADAELYDGALVTFPGTVTEPVVRHEVVDGHGVVAEGEAAVESTPAEVERVVELVLEHARRRPERSLVVIALAPGHRRLVETAVRTAVERLDDRTAAFFAEDRPEAFAVRDADHVQGETWDDAIVTVGFGKTPHGRVLHRFGPVGTDTGHRRLGVALTRARSTLTVVSSITAEDLDPDRLRTAGARMLRAVLEHVEAVSGVEGVRSLARGRLGRHGRPRAAAARARPRRARAGRRLARAGRARRRGPHRPGPPAAGRRVGRSRLRRRGLGSRPRPRAGRGARAPRLAARARVVDRGLPRPCPRGVARPRRGGGPPGPRWLTGGPRPASDPADEDATGTTPDGEVRRGRAAPASTRSATGPAGGDEPEDRRRPRRGGAARGARPRGVGARRLAARAAPPALGVAPSVPGPFPNRRPCPLGSAGAGARWSRTVGGVRSSSGPWCGQTPRPARISSRISLSSSVFGSIVSASGSFGNIRACAAW